MLGEMQEQLTNAIRRYDSLLTEQDNYARHQAELRRQAQQQQQQYQQPVPPQYGYMPPYGYPAPNPAGQPQYPYQQGVGYGYPNQHPAGPSMYPTMPAVPFPSAYVPSQPYAERSRPDQQPGFVPPQSYGSPPQMESTRIENRHYEQARQPLMADQASAAPHESTRQASYLQAQHTPLPVSPQPVPAAPVQNDRPHEAPQQYPSYPQSAPQEAGYQSVPTQETGQQYPSFPAFPDAPSQLPLAPVSTVEPPKEALLIEL
ncbi:hypothetical protein QFC22_003931 [Naganishia vaughanmartiniae]|uniref:Uncharacterized protein n=1 Tax=Naganishia vaughanmartiniae TaxID=1424756 RepID=A0ACC2X5L2_9TREE|nr:hypothetical protein QFC22_003931 [Naganishia vaughanmartiniae]